METAQREQQEGQLRLATRSLLKSGVPHREIAQIVTEVAASVDAEQIKSIGAKIIKLLDSGHCRGVTIMEIPQVLRTIAGDNLAPIMNQYSQCIFLVKEHGYKIVFRNEKMYILPSHILTTDEWDESLELTLRWKLLRLQIGAHPQEDTMA